ncbi:putrescine hydroxycinnamoyltransferase 3-like [Mercurialis annua]|uniref:putrescine hydroxycinnamoyltransferase 3-like n=1 Tax=Mercurialis annua TaxID=3986 RepID=UPI00215F64FC|nr:putrescine hydroxycinnamoyltransferase 3-like [Mercurialis annua]
MEINVRIDSTKIVVPIYDGNISSSSTLQFIPLSVFDKYTYNTHAAQIFAYHPPTPSNATIESGLKRVLSEYREFAGRLGEDEKGEPIIVLNDKGAKLVEASVDSKLDDVMPSEPSPVLRSLYPSLKEAEELVLVQLTSFACGSLVVGFIVHHSVADGNSTFKFLVDWGKVTRGVDISSLPLHDRTIFKPRNPPRFEFENRGVKFIQKLLKDCPDNVENNNNIVVQKVHFTADFLSKIKAMTKPYSTYDTLVAHLWRVLTKARGLNGFETSHVIVSVNGRMRMARKVPNEYLGNMVLWAFPSAKINDISHEQLPYVAKRVHDAISNVNNDYFESFIDFATYKLEKEEVCPTTTLSDKCISCPNLEVNSWVRFPIYDVDFGGGSPYMFLPSYFPMEGMIYLLPSAARDGTIDAFVFLFQNNVSKFKQIVYSLDHGRSRL